MKKVVVNFTKCSDDTFDKLIGVAMQTGGTVMDEGNPKGIVIGFDDFNEIGYVEAISEFRSAGVTVECVE